MIEDEEIEELFSKIYVSSFSGIEAKHVYAVAELAYKKGVQDAADKCERLVDSFPCDVAGVARLCRHDVLSLIS